MSDRSWPLSFEFFPPKTDAGREKLRSVRCVLAAYRPRFCSVTYGAGGSTRDNTRDTVLEIRAAGLDVAPHLSFGGDKAAAIRDLLATYRSAGVNRVVALRGDLPTGMGGSTELVHANELVAFIREHFGMGGSTELVHANELVAFIREHFGDDFSIHVAAYPEIHPEAASYQADIHWLAEKFRAGANTAITQYFYNIDAYWYFIDQCRKAGIEQAIVPGIMPITNFQSLARFSRNCGAEIPRWISQRLQQYGDDPDSVINFGIEVVSKLCEQLLAGGVPGLHFYTMNQAEPVTTILAHLGRRPA